MTPDELRAACLARRGAREEFPFPRYPERSVFKVAGKVFAISSLRQEPLRVSLKCDPELAEQLRAAYPAIEPGYRLNKRHWNTVLLDGSLPDELVRDLIEDSYDLIVAALPRAQRAALD
ncbi:MmcQ/YjbR family DNA-binding protein [Amycolatopsis anabasis]|uniref:MmcQ/YjbR family DNA-binding protein n=1 Tax=Amycolatopsis anabasis TaxID=1840409 RepID=UPI00131E991E|nr:MmcQ/YjbR family DNA-binding protein [Amycolatopsis anabasis]